MIFKCAQRGCEFDADSEPDKCPICGNPFISDEIEVKAHWLNNAALGENLPPGPGLQNVALGPSSGGAVFSLSSGLQNVALGPDIPIEEPDLVQVLFDEDGNLIVDTSCGEVVGLSKLLFNRSEVPGWLEKITEKIGHDNWFMLSEDILTWINEFSDTPP